MASIINVLSSAARKEAVELSEKLGISLEEAAQKVYQKYYSSPSVERVSPSLSEAVRGKGFTVTEPNIPAERALIPTSKKEVITPEMVPESTSLVPVGKVQPRTPGEIRVPSRFDREVEERSKPGAIRNPFTEEQLRLDEALRQKSSQQRGRIVPAVEESITAREASKYSEPTARKEEPLALPPGRKFPSKSDTSASEDFESSLGELDTGIYPEVKIPTAAKIAAGVGTVAGLSEAIRRSAQPAESSKQAEQKSEAEISPSKALEPVKGIEPVAGGEDYLKSLTNLSTPQIKEEAKKGLVASSTKAEQAQAAANKGTIPQAVADDFKQQRDEAYRRYDEAKSRNEWLELAQVLGQAVTQYGAAQLGMRTGRSMGGLQIPGVDYGARTSQEGRLLESRLRDIGEAETRKERLTEREQERADTAKYRNAELALKRQELKDKAEERAGRMSAEEKLEKTTLRDSLTKQLSVAQKQYQAALTFANQAAMEDDLSSKTLKKIEEKTPGLLGQAGIDPTELQQIEKDATDKGIIWDSLNPQKKQELIKERILDKHRNLLDSIQAQLDDLSRKKQPVSGGQPAARPATIQQTAPAPLSPEDQQALDWARSNPNDPRAAAIRQRLGR